MAESRETVNLDQIGTGGSSSPVVKVTGVEGASVGKANTAGVVYGGMGNETYVQNAEIIQNIHQHAGSGDSKQLISPLQKDEILTLKERSNTVSITWQQMFRQRRQVYVPCDYTTSTGATVPVFIQSDYTIRPTLTVDSSLQYGMQDGAVFYVYHNKEQTPYQHRFVKNEKQKQAYAANQLFPGFDMTWLVGDYLHDVK